MKKPVEPKRLINRELLRTHISIRGRRGRELMAVAVDCSSSLIEKMLTEKQRPAPDKRFRNRICAYFDVLEDELFPLANKSNTDTPTAQTSLPGIPTQQAPPSPQQPTHQGVTL